MVSGWSRIADLYAGSGAMGIEALSRGAEWGDFVEQDPRRCALIRENLQRTGLADRANIYCCKVSKAITFLDGKYNLIIIDPPYTGTSISDILERIATSKLVGEGSIIVVEHSSRVSLNSSYGDLGLKRHKRHGDSCISVYQ